jgi:hypothetical protein
VIGSARAWPCRGCDACGRTRDSFSRGHGPVTRAQRDPRRAGFSPRHEGVPRHRARRWTRREWAQWYRISPWNAARGDGGAALTSTLTLFVCSPARAGSPRQCAAGVAVRPRGVSVIDGYARVATDEDWTAAVGADAFRVVHAWVAAGA